MPLQNINIGTGPNQRDGERPYYAWRKVKEMFEEVYQILNTGGFTQIQVDWNELDTNSVSYIKNKPTIPSKTSELTNDSNFVSDTDYNHTDNNYTDEDKAIVDGLKGPQVGDTYQGFIVAYIFKVGDSDYEVGKTKGFLIGANLGTKAWALGSTFIVTDDTIGDGITNTANIVAVYPTDDIAANVTRLYTGGGFTDWFLPNTVEFIAITENRSLIPQLNVDDDEYWVSNNPSATQGILVSPIPNGDVFSASKSTLHKVIPIRYFTFGEVTITVDQTVIDGSTNPVSGEGVKTYVDNEVTTLKDGVPSQGNTLNKIYQLIVASFSEITVADITARNAYNVIKLPTNVFVLDDGDGKWALYKATTTGTNATYVKLSDPDLLNAVMTASSIKIAYESNTDTNAFTDALKAKIDSITVSLLELNTNKVSAFQGMPDNTHYPSEKLVYDQLAYLQQQVSSISSIAYAGLVLP